MHIQKATLCMKSIKQTKIYKEKKETKKKINYKRGGNTGTKGENHKPSSPQEEPLRLQECNSQGQIFLQEV